MAGVLWELWEWLAGWGLGSMRRDVYSLRHCLVLVAGVTGLQVLYTSNLVRVSAAL